MFDIGCFKPNFIVLKKLSNEEWKRGYPSTEVYCEDDKLRNQEYYDLIDSGVRFKVGKTKPVLYSYLNRNQLYWAKDPFKDWPKLYKHFELVSVPCGNCIGCRLDYSRDWATRCLLEAEQYDNNYFITLTYDDEHLPKGAKDNATLVPEDFTNFLKRLRSYYKREFDLENIRFFGCGEYGDLSMRPHYHIIMFNLPIPDLTPEFRYIDPVTKKETVTKHCQDGVIYYYSDIIYKLWGKGNILIGACTYQSCAYTARYVVKKLKGKSSEAYDLLAIVPPFVRMSRKPGLAYQYYLGNSDYIYDLDSIALSTDQGAKLVPPPRYFNKMYEIENELRYYQVKEYRKKKGEEYLNTLYENTNLHYSDYLECLEERKELQFSHFGRKL